MEEILLKGKDKFVTTTLISNNVLSKQGHQKVRIIFYIDILLNYLFSRLYYEV